MWKICCRLEDENEILIKKNDEMKKEVRSLTKALVSDFRRTLSSSILSNLYLAQLSNNVGIIGAELM